MAGELGKASLDLEANLGPFERNVTAGEATSDRLKDTLEALVAVANAAEAALNDVKMGSGQGAKSRITAEEIISGVHGITSEARDAAREIDRVHLSETQAAETEAAGAVIDHELENIHHKAGRARRALDGVRLRLAAAAAGAGDIFSGRNGVGVGPFGSGFGRVGALGAAIGVGALTAPAAGPAAAGLLAGIPTLATGAASALATLMLAFSGVGKAIGGDKKAFDDLTASQKQFVLTVRSLDGLFDRLKQIAGQSLFPGLTKGLKAALSPATVNAIETALVQLGHAFGSAGAAWGKYFGSARFQQIFGPLMQSAARNIGVLSDAFLHLFDAFGVLARAAIPFTNWLNTAIDRGAKFADTWLRARDATGQLGSAMREAQTSLKLVGGLALSLVRVVVELGVALYPVAKVAVKDLTDGLNGLAGIIHRNQDLIRDLVGTALAVLVNAVKDATKAIGFLSHAISQLPTGAKIALGLIAADFALLFTGPTGIVVAAIVALYEIQTHWRTIAKFFVTLGIEIVNAFKYAWYELEKGALKAALAVVEPFSHLPSFLGGWARKAKDSMQKQLDRLHPPDMNWSDNAARAGATTGAAWGDAFVASARSAIENLKPGTVIPAHRAGPRGQIQGAYVVPKKRTHHRTEPKPGTHDWYMKYLGYDPTQQPTFGSPGPFTKNTGGTGSKASVIPATAAHLIALASQQASIAANAKALKKEQTALNREILDLEKADKILHAKWRNAHGKLKTELFNEITTVENRIRSARKKLRDALAKGGGSSKLDYALAQAKVAVENAKEGSKAWDAAVNAEEKDLKAEIRYWDRRAHNDKLGLAARTAALKKELSYQKQLKALLAPIKAAASANIAQFLATWNDIENTFAPNALPIGGAAASPGGGSGKTDTHLHEIKNEARQTNHHLQAIRSQVRFPGSAAAQGAAMAVAG